jgi:hypothetical protein
LGKSIGSLEYLAAVVDAIKRPMEENAGTVVQPVPEEEEDVEELGHFDDADVRSDDDDEDGRNGGGNGDDDDDDDE